jgi:uncharacterized OsmC-like protein
MNETNTASPRGLDTYLSNKISAMTAAARKSESGDAVRETIAAECSASDLTGVRRVRIRDFQLISDSGAAFGGFSLGPSSPELLLGVLASCLTHTYLIGAAQRGMSLDEVHVRFEAENNDAEFLGLDTTDPPYPFNIRAVVRIESRANAHEIAELHEYAARTCPLTKLVREPQSIEVRTASEADETGSRPT